MGGMINQLFKRKKLSDQEEHEICMKCQFCCRWIGYHVALKANNPNYYSFTKEWGIKSSIDGDVVYFYVPFPCRNINQEKGCLIYEKRPLVCQKYRGGDSNSAIIPYCGWYEAVSDEERFKALRMPEAKTKQEEIRKQ